MSEQESVEKLPRYEDNTSGELWWCKSHNRKATSILYRKGMEPSHVCDPRLGGLLICCDAIKFGKLKKS